MYIYHTNFYHLVVVCKSLAVAVLEARVLLSIEAIYFADNAMSAGACFTCICTIIYAVHER
jgi:energy-converting hydrogenase Eha subunit C